MADKEHDHDFDKGRLEALTDGLFATVMTILVLSLVVPVITGPNLSQQLDSDIIALVPNLITYAASFIVLGVLWLGHNGIFRFVHVVNPRFRWLSIVFLLTVGAIPFSTALLGKYPLQQPAIITYGLNFLVVAVMFYSIAYHAKQSYRKAHNGTDTKDINLRLNLLPIVVYSFSLILSFVNPYFSLALFVLMPIYYISLAFIRPV